jgi:hypothetical protein
MGSAPFATVAIAGHIPVAGVYCDGTPPYCGHPTDGVKISLDEGDDFFHHDDSFTGTNSGFASATLIIGIALMMWTRSRA